MGARLISLSFAVLSLGLAVSCSSKKEKKETVSAEVEKKEQVDYATISFDKGEVTLSQMDLRHLNELSLKMSEAGKVVDDIKILSWSDKTLKKDNEATNTDIILARQRADNIKRYLESSLTQEENIDFYNMAESPERYGSFMKRKGIPVEQAFKGNTGTTDGKALVIIEYQTGPMPSQL